MPGCTIQYTTLIIIASHLCADYKSLLEIVHVVEIMTVLLVPRSKCSLLKRFTVSLSLLIRVRIL